MPLAEAKKKNFDDYEAIVYGGWACAGSINKINWFKSHVGEWSDKKLIAFCVGGSPIENPDVAVAMDRVFSCEDHEQVKVFYCPGGFDYEKMSTSSKLMMKAFEKACSAKKNKTESERNAEMDRLFL